MKLVDEKGRVLIENLEIADTFFKRLKGLLGRKGIKSNEGLLIIPCSDIHMFFMKFSIDIFFLKETGKNQFQVLKVLRNLKPWRMAFGPSQSNAVLETGLNVLSIGSGETLIIQE